tara:strand:- start:290 stop:475 length:186 start_codon:yes stop_codon:yes gene_type:complete
MKDLSKKIRNGGVQKFDGASLGVSRNGKGSFPRFNYQVDDVYKKNYDKIFGDKNEKPIRKH